MNLKEKRAAALAAAQKIVEGAKADGNRALSDEEQTQVKAHIAEVKDCDEKLAKAAEQHQLLADLGGLGADEAHEKSGSQAPAASLGDHFAKHAGQQLLVAKAGGGQFQVTSPEFLLPAKAAGDTHVTGGHEGPYQHPWLVQYDTNFVREVRRPLLTDLFGTGTIGGQAITYFHEGIREGDPGTVAEGGLKPQVHYTDPTPRTEHLRKLAVRTKYTDEMAEDLPFIVSEINGRLVEDLREFEEAQVLRGDGTGNNLNGLLNRSGLGTITSAGATDDADALYRAASQVQLTSGLSADAIGINPADYERLRLAKDGNQQYYGGGYFSAQYGNGGLVWQPPLWGLRTVVSSAFNVGEAVVGAFRQGAQVYRKGGIRVDATNTNEDDFNYNRISVRAENRLALVVRRPAAFTVVTLSSYVAPAP